MATVDKFALAKTLTPLREGGVPTHVVQEISVVSGDASNGDDVTILTVPKGLRVVDATLATSGTLGASCTVKLRQGTNDLTSATTAGSASVVQMDKFPPDVTTDDTAINLLVGGANIAASATIKVHVAYVRA